MPLPFVAVTIKVCGEPSAVFGTPLRIGELNWSPEGSPVRMANVGVGEPVPVNVKDPAWFATNVVLAALVIVGACGALMLMV
jgi:hypothetical protein